MANAYTVVSIKWTVTASCKVFHRREELTTVLVFTFIKNFYLEILGRWTEDEKLWWSFHVAHFSSGPVAGTERTSWAVQGELSYGIVTTSSSRYIFSSGHFRVTPKLIPCWAKLERDWLRVEGCLMQVVAASQASRLQRALHDFSGGFDTNSRESVTWLRVDT